MRAPTAGLTRAVALLVSVSLIAQLALVGPISSAPALAAPPAPGVDLLRTTTPAPFGFTKSWSCPFLYQGTNDSPFDGDDATFCTVDNGDPHNVNVAYGFIPGPSISFTIRSFRAKVDHTSSRAFLTSLRVDCGDNESGQVGRPTVWQAPASMLNVGALDTGYVNFDTPCQIVSNTGHAYGGINLSWSSSFPGAPFCCTGLRIYSFEAYGEPAGSPPDSGAAFAFTYGAGTKGASSPDPVNLGTGVLTTHSDDLVMPGRLLGLAFTRSYNSADRTPGPLGPGWTHTYNWTLFDATNTVEVRRGDGRRDTFTRNTDGSYADPPDVFDNLTRNADASFTLTLTTQTQYEFSSSGLLTRIHEPAGNQIALSYVAGNLSTLTDTVGRQVALSYDASNRLTQILDPLGRRVSYTYDASGRLATVTDKLGNAAGQDPTRHRWTYAYDGTTSHITSITDPDGRVRVTNSYDPQGRVTQQRDGLGALTTMSYTSGQTVLTDPRGHQTTYTFDSRMRVLSQSDPVGAATYTISYTYDAAGNRTSATDRNSNRTDFSYDGRGNLLSKSDPSPDGVAPRPVTSFAYDAKNNLTQITDAAGFVTALSYDTSTNVLRSVSRQIDATTNAKTTYEYTDAANPGLATRIIAPRGNTGPMPDYTFATTLAYDAQGNLVRRQDADGAITTFAYDAVGRLVSFVDPDGNAPGALPAEHTWRVRYDENDQEISRADPLGNTLRSSHDGAGNRVALTDRNGNLTGYGYDANTRLATVQQKPDPAGAGVYTTQVARDANGNATRITQANGVVTDYAYDAINRLTSVSTYPSPTTTLTTSYVLDGNGQPLTRTTGDGVSVSYTYDRLSRLTSVSGPSLSITYAYDAIGRRTRMSDATGVTTYAYDGLGRLTQVAAPNGTLGYAYDLDGNRTRLTYPNADAVSYAYSPGGRLTTVTDWAARISRYTYQASGLVATLSYPNAMVASYGYDRAQRLTALSYTRGSVMASERYTLDPEGNRTALSDLFGTTPEVAGTLRYDGLERLSSFERHVVANGFPVSNETFAFDPASNITSRTGPAATFSYDGANRLTSDGARSFSWDGADRLIQRGSDAFSYDALGRMTNSTVAGVTRTYSYDGDGLLRSRMQGTATTSFLYDPAFAPAPLLVAGTERIVYGLGPLYRVHANPSYDTFVRDGLGSVRLEVSATGTITNAFDYTAYGSLTASTAQPLLGFAGELHDTSRLMYLRARWYDPGVGRFTTADSIEGDTSDAASLNLYLYARDNPVVLTDPSGRCPMCWGAVFGFVGYVAYVNITHQQFDVAQAAIATGAGAATAGLSAFVGTLGFTGASAVAARIWQVPRWVESLRSPPPTRAYSRETT